MLKDVILLGAGAVVGGVNAVAGGGMLIGFPLLLALGLPPLTANATSNVIIAPGQFSSAVGYRKHLMRLPLKFIILALPCLIGAVAGTLTLRYTPATDFDRLAPWLVLLGVGLFILQPLYHKGVTKTASSRTQALKPLIIMSFVLLPLTFYGGYFGAGFGFMMLAILGFTTLRDIHAINAVKNLSSTLIATVSLLCLLTSGLINWHTGLFMAAGSVIGGYIGASTAQRLPAAHMRAVIICFGLAASAYLFITVY